MVEKHYLTDNNFNIIWRVYLEPCNEVIGYFITDEDDLEDYYEEIARQHEEGVLSFSDGWQEHGKLINYGEENVFRIYYSKTKQYIKFFVNGTLLRTTSFQMDTGNKYFYCYIPDKYTVEESIVSEIVEDDEIFCDEYTLSYLSFNSSLTFDPMGNIWGYQGAPAFTSIDAAAGQAVWFNGNSYLETENYIALGDEDFTVEGWAYMETDTGYQSRIFSMYREGKEFLALSRNLDQDCLRLIYPDNTVGTGGIGMAGTNPILGKLFHWAVVYLHSEGVLSLFVNGSKEIEITKLSFQKNGYFVRLGAKYSGEYCIKGTIDEFRISNTARYLRATTDLILLTFNHSCTEDECGNSWNLYNIPKLSEEHVRMGHSMACCYSGITKDTPLTLGGHDFTIDFWGYLDHTGERPSFCELAVSSSDHTTQQLRMGTFSLEEVFSVQINRQSYYTTENIIKKFNHYALVYKHDNQTFYVFINGALLLTIPNISFPQANFSLVTVGHAISTNAFFEGTVDNFRISNIARWTESFMLPTEQYIMLKVIPYQYDELTFNGDLQLPLWADLEEGTFKIDCEPQSNAGVYKAYFTPSPGYCWEDGGLDTREIEWKIAKATPILVSEQKNIFLSTDLHSVTFNVYCSGDNEISVKSTNPSSAIAQIKYNTQVTVVSGSVKGGSIIKIIAEESYNYNSVVLELQAYYEMKQGTLALSNTYVMLSDERPTADILLTHNSTGAVSYRISTQEIGTYVTNDPDTMILLHFDKESLGDECDTGEGRLWFFTNSNTTMATVSFVNSTNPSSDFNKALKISATAIQPQAIYRQSGITLGDQDFTIEWWAKQEPNCKNGTRQLNIYTYDNSAAGSITFTTSDSDTATVRVSRGGVVGETITFSYSTKNNTNYCHHAIVYENEKRKASIYINGTLKGVINVYLPNFTYPNLQFGDNNTTHLWSGILDEFRVSTIARWTEDFIPESKPYQLQVNKQYDEIVSVFYDSDTNIIFLTKKGIGAVIIYVTVAGDHNYLPVTKTIYVVCVKHGRLIANIKDELYTPKIPPEIFFPDLEDETGWLIYGEPYIATRNAKFTSALQLNGAVMLQRDISLGGQDFTIDFWYYMSSWSPEQACVFSLHNINHYMSLRRYEKENGIAYWTRGQEHPFEEPTIDRLTHFAIVYLHIPQKELVFIDGKLYYQGTRTFERQTFQLRLGAYALGSRHLIGTIDEFRISDGIARWTENFGPAQSPHAKDTYTLTLQHFNKEKGLKKNV